jgi:leukotriene-A4 hydrolase
MYYLEHTVVQNRPLFDSFLKSYINTFSGESITSDDLKAHFLSFFKDKITSDKLATINWDAWFYGTGDIPVHNDFTNAYKTQIDNLILQ